MLKEKKHKKNKFKSSKFNQSWKQTFKLDSDINRKININNKEIRIFYNIASLKDVPLPSKTQLNIVYTNKNTNPAELLNAHSYDIVAFASAINKKAIKFIENAKIIVGHHFKKYHYELYKQLNKTSEIKTRLNHAKILCYKEGGSYYCIFGSGNLSINARHEFYRIYNDKNIYNFVLNCYDDA